MLIPLKLDLGTFEIPSNVSQMIDSAWQSIQQFQLLTRKNPVHGFHPGDFSESYYWLALLLESRFLPNSNFCEWGSGFSVVALIAAEIGFQSVAIESDPKLFHAAGIWRNELVDPIEDEVGELDSDARRRLHENFEAYCGSFIPSSVQNEISGAKTKWIDHSAASVFDRCRWKPDDFGLTYAYPWPGEESFIFELFDLIAKPGSLLLTFHGAADFRLHQKADSENANQTAATTDQS